MMSPTFESGVTSPDDCVTDFRVEVVAESCSKLLMLSATEDMASMIFVLRAALFSFASAESSAAS